MGRIIIYNCSDRGISDLQGPSASLNDDEGKTQVSEPWASDTKSLHILNYLACLQFGMVGSSFSTGNEVGDEMFVAWEKCQRDFY